MKGLPLFIAHHSVQTSSERVTNICAFHTFPKALTEHFQPPAQRRDALAHSLTPPHIAKCSFNICFSPRKPSNRIGSLTFRQRLLKFPPVHPPRSHSPRVVLSGHTKVVGTTKPTTNWEIARDYFPRNVRNKIFKMIIEK